ncbi:PilZ domain-containing protein [Altererythrobacter xixiisoli]|uniref:PilZ domain-containing protein n=1 Tax=Croceibacterium xixiisoli TaxID=1476466 RepID=A0A6I4TUR1_9SPHN|nr:PilZ domain-containing protein [Croceibacterium xixiisoli]MXO99985.1 PilZ domain-containing protein [Croceibacterium xixiisoli]
MAGGAQLSVTDLRQSARHPLDLSVIAEHRNRGDIPLHIANISAHGFMLDRSPPLERGDRVMFRLPIVGRIESYCMWVSGERAGMQFERVIRLDDFNALIRELKPAPRVRHRGA